MLDPALSVGLNGPTKLIRCVMFASFVLFSSFSLSISPLCLLLLRSLSNLRIHVPRTAFPTATHKHNPNPNKAILSIIHITQSKTPASFFPLSQQSHLSLAVFQRIDGKGSKRALEGLARFPVLCCAGIHCPISPPSRVLNIRLPLCSLLFPFFLITSASHCSYFLTHYTSLSSLCYITLHYFSDDVSLSPLFLISQKWKPSLILVRVLIHHTIIHYICNVFSATSSLSFCLVGLATLHLTHALNRKPEPEGSELNRMILTQGRGGEEQARGEGGGGGGIGRHEGGTDATAGNNPFEGRGGRGREAEGR